jgi:hypothetical protein
VLRRSLCLPDVLRRGCRLLRREGVLLGRQGGWRGELLDEGWSTGLLQREVRISRGLMS